MKKIALLAAVFSVLLFGSVAFRTEAICVSAQNDTTAKSAILMDFDSKEVLFEKNSKQHLPVASMVKMMTIFLVCEDIENGKISADDIVTVSENASGMGGSQVFIDAYEGYKLEELLKSVIIASANDSSVALAEFISGNEKNFVARMNKTAKNLGMENTNYVNCTGLPAPEQYSCAFDSAIILSQVNKFDLYHKYSNIWMDQIVHPSNRVTGLTNTNRLVKYYQGCDGGKTGSTNEAGCCLAATAKRDDMRLISVVVGAENSKTRFNECSSLFNFGFANFENKQLVDSSLMVDKIAVKKGYYDSVEVFAQEDYFGLINKNEESEFKIKFDKPKNILAGLKAGDKIGSIYVLKNGEEVKKINLIIKQDLKQLSYGGTFKKVVNQW